MLNEEQIMLRDMARSWARNESPVTEFRKLRDSGNKEKIDRNTLSEIAEMGWTGIIIPEAYGGSDFGCKGLGLVVEELARTHTANPLTTSSFIVASAILLGGNAAQRQAWLPGICSGELVGAFAFDEGFRHAPDKIETQATRRKSGWMIAGQKAFVAEGGYADFFVVSAKSDDGPGLFIVPSNAEGVSREARSVIDARNHIMLKLDNVKLDENAELGEMDGQDLIDKVLDRARVGTACELLGLSTEAFENTLEYLKTREQFDQILARFQALQHRMADLFTEIELTRAVIAGALDEIDSNGMFVSERSSLAKARATQTANLMTREMIQLHGGIGMTDEHDAGFYIKRSRVLEQAWGNASFHQERYAELKGY